MPKVVLGDNVVEQYDMKARLQATYGNTINHCDCGFLESLSACTEVMES